MASYRDLAVWAVGALLLRVKSKLLGVLSQCSGPLMPASALGGKGFQAPAVPGLSARAVSWGIPAQHPLPGQFRDSVFSVVGTTDDQAVLGFKGSLRVHAILDRQSPYLLTGRPPPGNGPALDQVSDRIIAVRFQEPHPRPQRRGRASGDEFQCHQPLRS